MNATNAYEILTSKTGNSGKVVRGGHAIQVSEQEADRIWAATGGKGGQIVFRGETREITGFGDDFKIGKVKFRYVYLAAPLPCVKIDDAVGGSEQTEHNHAI